MAWVAALLMAAAVSFSVVRIPLQVTDNLLVMLQLQAAPSTAAVFSTYLGDAGFFRPLYWTQSKALLDLSGGDYFFAYKAFHVALVCALFFLFVRTARVRTRTDVAAFVFALTVLTGLHTFRGTLWESYPINHYLQIAVLCLGALALCQSRGGWWVDAAAGALFVFASLALESGLIVWVVCVTGRITGMRGVSWKGVGLVSILLAGYFVVRFGVLATGAPGIDERATGFLLGRLDRTDLAARFSDGPYALYAYNIIASLFSVILSEPRGGTLEMTKRFVDGDVAPWVVVAIISSTIATGMIVWFAASRFRQWRGGQFDHADQLVVVALGVIAANAAVCFLYTKDEIISTAGVFYALAVFAAMRTALTRFAARPRSTLATAVMLLLLVAASTTWAIRSTGLHYHLYYAAHYSRNEWATVQEWLRDQHSEPTTKEGQQMVADLRAAGVAKPVLNLYFLPRWAERWFG
jgi:hypothetical protein